jgi:uncharacterized OsmC-like protein
MYLRKHKLADQGTRVKVSAEKLKDPARLGNFHIKLAVPVDLTPKHRDGLEQAVHHCLIHNTLLHPPAMTIEIKSAVLSRV